MIVKIKNFIKSIIKNYTMLELEWKHSEYPNYSIQPQPFSHDAYYRGYHLRVIRVVPHWSDYCWQIYHENKLLTRGSLTSTNLFKIKKDAENHLFRLCPKNNAEKFIEGI